MGLLDKWNKSSKSVKDTIQEAVDGNLSLSITYRKYDGEISNRQLRNVSYNNSFIEKGYYNDHIKGFCTLRQEDRTFKIDRIIKVEIIQ